MQGLDSILENLYDQDNFQILVTADIDDPEMRDLPQYVIDHPRIRVQYGVSKSKIDAVNRDMEFAEPDWDIVVVMSDDFRITFDGFDEVVRGQYKEHGLDTLLHIPDQDAKICLRQCISQVRISTTDLVTFTTRSSYPYGATT